MRAVFRQKRCRLLSQQAIQFNSIHVVFISKFSLSSPSLWSCSDRFKIDFICIWWCVCWHKIPAWLSDRMTLQCEIKFISPDCVDCVGVRLACVCECWTQIYDFSIASRAECVSVCVFSATCPPHQYAVTPNTFLLLRSRTHKFRCDGVINIFFLPLSCITEQKCAEHRRRARPL